MTVRGVPAPADYLPSSYWEDRARRFAAQGAGLAAVCSYGMPEFYNRFIHWTQYLALNRWIQVQRGTRVLDVGCGVGRWSSLMAQQGAQVTGMDLSPTMITEANRRASAAGLQDRCDFRVQDLAHLDAGRKFDLVLGVTVLQHILDAQNLRCAVERMADHLAPGGRMVLLEAAPTRLADRCDTTVFRARERKVYLDLFASAGLDVVAMAGVDPAPFKTWLLPHLRRMPKRVAMLAVAFVTLLSAPIDLLLGRRCVSRSWHAVFVLKHTKENLRGV